MINKRKAELTMKKFILLLLEVFRKCEYIAPQAVKQESFQTTTDVLEGMENFRLVVNENSVSDRYERMHKALDESNKIDEKIFGGEATEVGELWVWLRKLATIGFWSVQKGGSKWNAERERNAAGKKVEEDELRSPSGAVVIDEDEDQGRVE